MKITRENYESFFIDLIDGTLAVDEVDKLLDFMRENPDLAEELKGLEKIKLKAENEINYTSKSLLKSDLDQADIFEETCIRSIENELTEKEEAKFQQYLKGNKNAENEYRLFKATISEPETLAAFSNKNSLKRNRKILAYWYAYAAVLLIGFLMWFNFDNKETVIELATIVPLNETPVVELKMKNYKPTFAQLIENKKIDTPENIIPEKEIIPRKIENIAFLISSPVYAITESNYSDNLDFIPVKKSDHEIYPGVGEYIAFEINKLNPKEKASQLAQNALNKVKNVSNDKIDFATNSKGKVKKIEFNSKLLAFSFPVNSK